MEHPIYTQVIYCLDRVKVIADQEPALKKMEPFKTVLSGDWVAITKLSMKDLQKILGTTLTGSRAVPSRGEQVDHDRQAPEIRPPVTPNSFTADAGGNAPLA